MIARCFSINLHLPSLAVPEVRPRIRRIFMSLSFRVIEEPLSMMVPSINYQPSTINSPHA